MITDPASITAAVKACAFRKGWHIIVEPADIVVQAEPGTDPTDYAPAFVVVDLIDGQLGSKRRVGKVTPYIETQGEEGCAAAVEAWPVVQEMAVALREALS